MARIIKSPKYVQVQNPQIKMHEKCMKCENKSKKKGKRVLLEFGERNLTKRMIKNDKNLRWSQA